MSQVSRTILKGYIDSSGKTTQSHFYTLIDSTFNLVDDQAILGLRVYSTTHSYLIGDITVYNGLFYQAIAATSGTFNPAAWIHLENGMAQFKVYSTTYNYAIGDLTIFDGLFYEAIEATSGTFDPDAWVHLENGVAAFTVYSTTHEYVVGDITVYGGLFYEAIENTSGTFDPGAWVHLTNGIAAFTVYSTTYDYTTGDLTVFDGLLYQAIGPTSGTFDPALWVHLENGVTGFTVYSTTHDYAVGDLTIFDGLLYQAIEATSGTFDPAAWMHLENGTAPFKIYSTTYDYAVGDLTVSGGLLYQAIEATSGTFDPAAWTLLANGISPFKVYSTTYDYVVGDLTVFDGILYQALVDISGTFNPDGWLQLTDGVAGFRVYSTAHAYAVGDLTVFGGLLYKAIEPTSGTFDADAWVENGAAGFTVYSTTRNYVEGDLTVFSDHFYEALSSTSGTFDPASWSLIDTGGGGPSIVSLLYSELAELKAASSLVPGQVYFINDKNIWLQAITIDKLSLDGYYLAYTPDYNNTSGNNVGVWSPSLSGLVPGVSIAIWFNVQYLNATGSAGTDPRFDAGNWSVMFPGSDGYISEIDNIKYDFDIDFIHERRDKRDNVVISSDPDVFSGGLGSLPFDVFQWGRDAAYGNTVENAVFDNSNALVANRNVRVINFSNVTVADEANCSGAIFSCSVLSPGSTSDLQYSVISNYRFHADIEFPGCAGKRFESGFSNFEILVELDGSGSGDLDLNRLDYAGIVNVSSPNPVEELFSCSHASLTHPFEIRPVDGLELIINDGSGFSLPTSHITLHGSKRDFAKFRADESGVVRFIEMVNYL